MTTQPTLELRAIGQLMVPVSDVERATAFYRDVLGLPFLFAFPGNAFFDADGVRLYLARPTEPGFDGHVTIYFRVSDVTAAVERLEARGATFFSRPHVTHRDTTYDLWMAFARDPDGNNIGLMAEMPKPAG